MSSATVHQRHGAILKAIIHTVIQHLKQKGQWWPHREGDHTPPSTTKVMSTQNFYLQTSYLPSKATDRWGTNGQNTEVVAKCNYLEVMLESIRGGLNKQKTLAKTVGHQVPVAINKCLSVTPI